MTVCLVLVLWLTVFSMESRGFCDMKGCQLNRDDHSFYLKKSEETDVLSLTNIVYIQKLKDFFPLRYPKTSIHFFGYLGTM